MLNAGGGSAPESANSCSSLPGLPGLCPDLPAAGRASDHLGSTFPGMPGTAHMAPAYSQVCAAEPPSGVAPPAQRHAHATQIPGMRHSTSALQGHGIDEPEALAEALRRSRGCVPAAPTAAPADAPHAMSHGRASSRRAASATVAGAQCRRGQEEQQVGSQPRRVERRVGMDAAMPRVSTGQDEPPCPDSSPAGPGQRGAHSRPGSVSAMAMRQALREAPVPEPEPVPVTSAFSGGVIICPCCEAAACTTASGLMRHLTCTHSGTVLTEEAVTVLRLLDRAVCTETGCGGINRVGVRQCNRCGRGITLRPLRAGDVVPGPRASSAAGPLITSALPTTTGEGELSQATTLGVREDVSLPADWCSRVRKLPAQTKPHVPLAFRARHAQAWSFTLEGMALGLPGCCKLEEARSKLLLGEAPQGVYGPKELGDRFDLWASGSYEALLVRAEAQALLRQGASRRLTARQRNAQAQAKRRRAKKLMAEGAYRKAVASLSSDVARHTQEEQQQWAARLLPSSAQPDRALQPAPMDQDASISPELFSSGGADHPLKGVRYAACTAPGPSGTRPEHAKEAFGIRQKALARRLARAMLKVQQLAQAGRLPEDARWLTRTRLVFLAKPGSDVPRPVRMGEFLRSSASKKLMRLAAPRLRTVFRQMHQWGVEMPGGAEALVHWRDTVESLALQGSIDPVVAFDLDLANMFCSIEWPEIRAAVSKHFAEARPWIEWSHQEPEVVELPCGATHEVNRGAGQGDVFGSANSALALGERVLEHRERFPGMCSTSAPLSGPGAVDEWFIDDGQAFVRPEFADAWLRSVDQAIADLGGSRGQGVACKSHARLLCTRQHAATHPDWASLYIRETCIVEDGLLSPKVLGVHLGSNEACNADLERVCSKVDTARQAIQELNSPCAELTLQRACLNVSKATYVLRCQGDRLTDTILRRFDQGMATGLESSLWGGLPDDSWHQATLAVDAGGLGMREAQGIALPAFLASRAVARPLVAEMARHTSDAAICSSSLCMQAYDERTQAALARWLAVLPASEHSEVRAVLEDAHDQAGARWRAWCEGAASPPAITGGAEAVSTAGGVIGDAGTADPEHPRSAVRGGALLVQHLLCKVLDKCASRGLAADFTAQERWPDLSRLSDLCAADASHDWLWAADPHKGRPLEAEEFVSAVRLRLGCGGPDEASICGNCGVAVLGSNGEHALLCARGESTRGHNCVRDELHSMARSVDSSAETEPEGLIPSHPRHRPADVLTGAFHNGRLAAVDVGIICPSASGAGLDCVVSMEERKRGRMAPFREEMEAHGVTYHPFVISCWGRLHPAAEQMLLTVSQRVARRDGSTNQRAVLTRLRSRITTEVMRRAAKMVLCCMPPCSPEGDAALPRDEAPPSLESSLRSGHPGACQLPPLYPAPRGGVQPVSFGARSAHER